MNNKYFFKFIFIITGIILTLTGCFRGRSSEKPPIHLVPDMDYQQKYQPQEKSEFFYNKSAMRLPPEGTVSRSKINKNSIYYQGKDENGKLVQDIPVPVTYKFLKRGQERFDIYCSVCHSRIGDGKGILFYKGYGPPANFHVDSLRIIEDGHIYNVITYGKNNMPSLSHQIPVHDRWAIVGYVRAIQRSQNATISDIPLKYLGNIKSDEN